MRILKGLFQKVDQLLSARRAIDEDLFDELEESLVQADLNVHTTLGIMENLRQAARQDRLRDSEDVRERLKEQVVQI
ncbi:MAG: signal recognition particle receptor subunit alpha, partial [Armatimonadetes bacterium]|nr:signal recognition particle receptor subunit alpha [Armatimonadota bacterium]